MVSLTGGFSGKERMCALICIVSVVISVTLMLIFSMPTNVHRVNANTLLGNTSN